jgi:phage gp29-like protein
MQIVLALLFQNLTTEVKGGSFAATSAHMDIRQQGIQADNSAWRLTIHNQVARPFAQFNFGDASLAPWSEWDAAPREDHTANAESFAKLSTSMQALAAAGVKFTDADEVRQWAGKAFGLRELPAFTIADPPAAVTAKAADKTADASHKTGDASLISAAAAKTKAEQPPPPPKVPA